MIEITNAIRMRKVKPEIIIEAGCFLKELLRIDKISFHGIFKYLKEIFNHIFLRFYYYYFIVSIKLIVND